MAVALVLAVLELGDELFDDGLLAAGFAFGEVGDLGVVEELGEGDGDGYGAFGGAGGVCVSMGCVLVYRGRGRGTCSCPCGETEFTCGSLLLSRVDSEGVIVGSCMVVDSFMAETLSRCWKV